MPTTIAVCMASFNRRAHTLSALQSLRDSTLPQDATLTVFLLEDASSDGTAQAVSEAYPEVRLLHGDGQRYWAGGMRMAFGAALAEGFDHYVWLNDDVALAPDAILRLLKCYAGVVATSPPGQLHLIAGAMAGPSGKTTYGGMVRAAPRTPWKHRLVIPDAYEPRPCETVNGNLLLIPASLATRLGNIDAVFPHGIGDFDYGLRAGRAGAKVWLAPGHFGVCSSETSAKARWEQPGLSLKQRWARIQHPLGLPFRAHWTYANRHYGAWGPLIGFTPYVRLVLGHLGLGGWRSGAAK